PLLPQPLIAILLHAQPGFLVVKKGDGGAAICLDQPLLTLSHNLLMFGYYLQQLLRFPSPSAPYLPAVLLCYKKPPALLEAPLCPALYMSSSDLLFLPADFF